MSNEGFKVQASIKDADGDMVNFRADSPEEMSHYLTAFPYADYAAAKAALRGAGAAAPIVQPAQQAPAQPQAAPAWSQPQQQAAPAVPQVRLHPEGKTCYCGRTLEYKEVNRKSDGKTFKFWSCPAQQKKGDGHDTEFAD